MRLIVHDKSLAPRALPAQPAATVPSPGVLTKGRRLMMAFRRWNREGRKLSTRDVRRQRKTICDACPYWNAKGNLGLGECRAPGCGCTRAKVWLASETCPLKKW